MWLGGCLTFDMDSWNVDLKVASLQNFWHFALLLLYPNAQKGYEGRHPWNVGNVLLRYHIIRSIMWSQNNVQ